MTQLSGFNSTSSQIGAVVFGLRNPTTGNKTLALSWTGSAFPTVEAITVIGSDVSSDANAFLKNLVISLQTIEANHPSGYNQIIELRWIRTGFGGNYRPRPLFICVQLPNCISRAEVSIAADALVPPMRHESSASALARSSKPSAAQIPQTQIRHVTAQSPAPESSHWRSTNQRTHKQTSHSPLYPATARQLRRTRRYALALDIIADLDCSMRDFGTKFPGPSPNDVVRGPVVVTKFLGGELAQKVQPMNASSPKVIEIKLDRIIDDLRFLRSQMIAFDKRLKEIEVHFLLGKLSEQQPESKSAPWFAAAARAATRGVLTLFVVGAATGAVLHYVGT